VCAGQLLSPNLAEFQGPALYVYNDGLFNEKDFQSISKIGNSAKREQVGKTGRFGEDVPGYRSFYA
jgi:sacsin